MCSAVTATAPERSAVFCEMEVLNAAYCVFADSVYPPANEVLFLWSKTMRKLWVA